MSMAVYILNLTTYNVYVGHYIALRVSLYCLLLFTRCRAIARPRSWPFTSASHILCVIGNLFLIYSTYIPPFWFLRLA
jgi:hypothetical protein